MQFGFNLPLSGPSASPAMLARLAAEGEAIGYDYAAISDHIVEPTDIHARCICTNAPAIRRPLAIQLAHQWRRLQ